MSEVAELQNLHRVIDQLRAGVEDARRCYGDIPAVRRLVGDVERIGMDIHDLDAAPAPPRPSQPVIEYISDEPADASMWADADDEGLGGYRGAMSTSARPHGGRGR